MVFCNLPVRDWRKGLRMFIGFVGVCLELILGRTACSCVNVGQHRTIYHLEPCKFKDMISTNLTIPNSYIWNSKVWESVCVCPWKAGFQNLSASDSSAEQHRRQAFEAL